jgi:hypothetical protein
MQSGHFMQSMLVNKSDMQQITMNHLWKWHQLSLLLVRCSRRITFRQSLLTDGLGQLDVPERRNTLNSKTLFDNKAMELVCLVVLVFDASCRQSFLSIESWVKALRRDPYGKYATVLLVGNKVDLELTVTPKEINVHTNMMAFTIDCLIMKLNRPGPMQGT